ncbi:translation initiation factor IF-2 [Roseomonas sp. JC162]|uniref:Translation initiation factor IF-2 n=1 Tax=Neoroseomonas marina TaxID=1232220 RepID=A0A848E6L0_9PROT|nr:translation initiation factor IF-2 [Neoroseomonas marina]NMJ39756.1 translation initiation factor IF-2 [Neoroseomonas marina]
MSAHLAALPVQAPARPGTWRAAAERWLARLRDRDDMARMTSREMRDAGLTPYDVQRECAKPFWKD